MTTRATPTPFAPEMLRKMRGCCGMSQKDLAIKLCRLGMPWITQTEISRLELSASASGFRLLQRVASDFFRSIGFDADDNGALIYIPPSRPNG